MQTALQIVFHGMDRSDAVEARIAEEFHKIERFHNRITDGRVTIEAPHRSRRKGRLYRVAVAMGVPGGHLDADTDGTNPAHEDVYVAVRDAFAAIARQLHADADRKKAHR